RSDHQPPTEEQGVRVLLTTGQQQKLLPVAADQHIHRRVLRHTQADAIAGQTPGHAQVADLDAQPAPGKHIELAICQRLGEQPLHRLLQHQLLQSERHVPTQWQQRAAGAQYQVTDLQHSPASSTVTMPGWPCQYPLQPSSASGGGLPRRTRSNICTISPISCERGLSRRAPMPISRMRGYSASRLLTPPDMVWMPLRVKSTWPSWVVIGMPSG